MAHEKMGGGGGGSSFVGSMASASTTMGNYPSDSGNPGSAALCPTMPYYIFPACNGGGVTEFASGEDGLVVLVLEA